MKKLEQYAMNPQNDHYEQAISREIPLYSREYDIRSPFNRDYTRIIFSQSYRRLRNKTQVFFSVDNDHVCTRNEHVNLVESISYTIGQALGLNTELTRAIAMGHDLGHAPFGHGGEMIIRHLCQKCGLPPFWHERHGLRLVDDIETMENDEHHLLNLDLTYAVRDGIISHCGEMRQKIIKPRSEAIDLRTYQSPGEFEPYTYEGCVVKMSDKIAYLARDIEDALQLHIITQEQVDGLKDELNQIAPVFSSINNGTVVNYFINDVINNSSSEGIALSDKAYAIMHKIMDFNYANIYIIKRVQVHTKYVELIINSIYDFLAGYRDADDLLEALKKDEGNYPKLIGVYLRFLNKCALIEGHPRHHRCDNKIVYDMAHDEHAFDQSIIDFIAGMTDSFLQQAFNELLTF